MTIIDPFKEFDHPYQISHVSVTEGHTDQDTGVYVPGSTTRTGISGNLEDLTLKDLERLPEGEYNIGDRKIHTGAALNEKDELEISEPDGSTSRWQVRTLSNQTSLLAKRGINRQTYLLKRMI